MALTGGGKEQEQGSYDKERNSWLKEKSEQTEKRRSSSLGEGRARNGGKKMKWKGKENRRQ
jgi:hypothetical protein